MDGHAKHNTLVAKDQVLPDSTHARYSVNSYRCQVEWWLPGAGVGMGYRVSVLKEEKSAGEGWW